ncbi:MAG: hypothetical protein IJ714_06115 [Bacteroidales bacterium]|nr:hypothetical protein [Bacteroidales bacterium]
MKRYWMIAAALVLAACAKTEVEAPVEKENPTEKVWTVSVEATKVDAADATKAAEADGWDGDAAETKSLDNSVESRIDFYWSMTDYVEVYKLIFGGEDLDYVKVGTLAPRGVGSTGTTLNGELTGNFAADDVLLFIFPKLPADEKTPYMNQKGTVADIAKNFDFASALMKVTAVDSESGKLTLENENGGSTAEFENAQSITKFSFSYASVNSEGIVKLTITAPFMAGEVTVIPDTPGTEFYVAIPDSGMDQKLTYTFMAETESGKIYEATRKANLVAGKYYKALVSGMAEYKPVETPLTIEAREAGVITINNPLNRTIMYNAEGQGFTHMTTKYTSANPIEIAVTAGQRVILGGENETYADANAPTQIFFNTDCYVYGNVMSLVNWQYYGSPERDSRVSTAKDWAFTRLFGGWSGKDTRPHLLNHPVKTIELPATSVGKGAYRLMFAFCTNMTVAPELPATTFTGGPYDTIENNQPYGLMFYYCHSLRRGPSILPATTVPAACYYRMFDLCPSLEASPVLPAQYPGDNAYRDMFNGCTNLKQITCYAKGNLGNSGATRNWVGGVPSTGIFIKDPDASWPIGVHGIPTGWTYDNPVPLTVEAVENGTLTINNPQGLSITWGKEVSMASATTTSLTTISIPMTAGDKIRLWGDNARYGGAGAMVYLNTNITSTAAHYVYGDIRSLLSKSDFPNVSSIPDRAFYGLFSGNTGLRSHPEQTLTMGASAVGEYALTEMFARCTGLVRAPELPATSLAEGCYAGMFGDCTALTEAPPLPATTLATECYGAMFSGCSALVNAPALPATALAEGCYDNMFNDCSSLVAAPDLPALTLKEGCYSYMFRNCTSLRTVRCMATNPILSDYGVEPAIEGNVDDWLENTYATGTFSKKSGVTWPAGSIPSGWSVTNL